MNMIKNASSASKKAFLNYGIVIVFFIDNVDFLHHLTANERVTLHQVVIFVVAIMIVLAMATIHVPHFPFLYKALIRILAMSHRNAQEKDTR